MTPKSPNSIRKSIVTNPEMPLRVRLRALREMNPSIRFLNQLLKEPSLPEKLRAKALYLLAEHAGATTLTEQKAKAKVPVVETDTGSPNVVPQESDSGPIIIDAELWDILGGFKDPLYVRGPGKNQETPNPNSHGS